MEFPPLHPLTFFCIFSIVVLLTYMYYTIWEDENKPFNQKKTHTMSNQKPFYNKRNFIYRRSDGTGMVTVQTGNSKSVDYTPNVSARQMTGEICTEAEFYDAYISVMNTILSAANIEVNTLTH